MIGKRLDHPAFDDATVAASFNHHFQLGLERRQANDTLLDLAEPLLGDTMNGCAGPGRIVRFGSRAQIQAEGLRLVPR